MKNIATTDFSKRDSSSSFSFTSISNTEFTIRGYPNVGDTCPISLNLWDWDWTSTSVIGLSNLSFYIAYVCYYVSYVYHFVFSDCQNMTHNSYKSFKYNSYYNVAAVQSTFLDDW